MGTARPATKRASLLETREPAHQRLHDVRPGNRAEQPKDTLTFQWRQRRRVLGRGRTEAPSGRRQYNQDVHSSLSVGPRDDGGGGLTGGVRACQETTVLDKLLASLGGPAELARQLD